MGYLCEINDNNLRVVSLDGHRISIRKIELKESYSNKKVVVPGKTLQEISKIIPGNVDDDVITAADLTSYVGDDKQYRLSLSFTPSSPEYGSDYWYEGTLEYIETTILNAG